MLIYFVYNYHLNNRMCIFLLNKDKFAYEYMLTVIEIDLKLGMQNIINRGI